MFSCWNERITHARSQSASWKERGSGWREAMQCESEHPFCFCCFLLTDLSQLCRIFHAHRVFPRFFPFPPFFPLPIHAKPVEANHLFQKIWATLLPISLGPTAIISICTCLSNALCTSSYFFIPIILVIDFFHLFLHMFLKIRYLYPEYWWTNCYFLFCLN